MFGKSNRVKEQISEEEKRLISYKSSKKFLETQLENISVLEEPDRSIQEALILRSLSNLHSEINHCETQIHKWRKRCIS